MSVTAQLDIFSALEAIDRTERTQHLPRTFTTSNQYTASDLAVAYDAWQGENPDLYVDSRDLQSVRHQISPLSMGDGC